MGKRSDFVRIERDYYKTPWEPVVDLSAHILDVEAFIEPCCGDGTLIAHLESLGHECTYACDLAPQEPWMAKRYVGPRQRDALKLTKTVRESASHFITNPPWPARHQNGQPTLRLIRHLSSLLPTWLLLSADFMHNVYASEVLPYCVQIVSVGRVRWIAGSANDGKDNAAWYLFNQQDEIRNHTVFFGRGHGRPVYASDIEELL